MPARVFLDPRLGKLTDENGVIEAIMNYCKAWRSQYSDDRAEVCNAVPWQDLWGTKTTPIRLGANPTSVVEDAPQAIAGARPQNGIRSRAPRGFLSIRMVL